MVEELYELVYELEEEVYESNNGVYYSNVPKNFKLPRTFIIKNEEGNKEIYGSLLLQVGETIRFESDKINGVFNVILDNGEIKLK